MKLNKSLITTLVLLIVVAACYRVIPMRPMGFAPHLAMALFAGAVIPNRVWAFAFPIFSLFLSDLLYAFLHAAGLTSLTGFYEGQLINYLLFAALTAVGFYMKRISVKNIVLFSLLVSVLFFILSNFFVWTSGAGFARPRTFEGLMMCYADALPFFGNSVAATLIFSAVLFGVWKLLVRRQQSRLAAVKR